MSRSVQEARAAITGVHALIYTPEADALRAVLSDAIGWSSVDAGEGWLIFALPPAELGVHPSDQPRHEFSLMCDDIAATVAGSSRKGSRSGVSLRNNDGVSQRPWSCLVAWTSCLRAPTPHRSWTKLIWTSCCKGLIIPAPTSAGNISGGL